MSEIDDFKRALRAAGEPWRSWGVRVGFLGMAALVVLQVAAIPYAVYALIVVVAVLATGCGMVVMSHLKQREWAKAHPITDVPLSDVSLGDAP